MFSLIAHGLSLEPISHQFSVSLSQVTMQNEQNSNHEHNFAVRWFRKARAYTLERVLPVGLLWLAIALGAGLLPKAFSQLTNHSNALNSIPLDKFVDENLLWLFGIGFAVLTAGFQLTRRLIAYSAKENANEAIFFTRIWDEISGACTHLACGLAVLWYLGPAKADFPGVICAYLLVGAFAFRLQEPSTQSDETTMTSTPA